MLTFPNIDPVMIHLGPIPIRWYGVAYIVGIFLAFKYAEWIIQRFSLKLTKNQIDNFLIWALLGIILGGRLGHVLFFEFDRYLENPSEILMTWKGGMSFHGGMIGMIVSMILYCQKNKISFLNFTDIIATATPIGLLLGRMANFINGELYGRVTDISWGMIFPHGGPLPRHPSQLYEAFLEGIILLICLHLSWHTKFFRRFPGQMTGIFLLGYGMARTLVEFVREPDTFYTISNVHLTTGQLLSLPMILAGIYFIWQPYQKKPIKSCID